MPAEADERTGSADIDLLGQGETVLYADIDVIALCATWGHCLLPITYTVSGTACLRLMMEQCMALQYMRIEPCNAV